MCIISKSSCSAEKIIPEGGGSPDRLWWEPNGMHRKGSRMDWYWWTHAVAKEKAGQEEIFSLKWWQENCKLPKLTLSAFHEMEGKFEKNEACYNVFHTELNGRAMKSFSSPQSKCTEFYRPLVNYDFHYYVSPTTVLQQHRWLLETSFSECPWKQGSVKYMIIGDPLMWSSGYHFPQEPCFNRALPKRRVRWGRAACASISLIFGKWTSI